MLQNKIVFITGASSGIGEATAWKCAEAGAHLVLNARNEEKLQELQTQIQEKHPECKVHVAAFDVSDKELVKQSIESIPSDFSSIDVLVNNAGMGRGRSPFNKCNTEDWDEMIDINMKGFLYVAHAVVQGMVERNIGTIINVGSVAGKRSYASGNVYCGTKAAVQAISDGMRIDLMDHNIRVTNIMPGKVETKFSENRFRGDTSKYADEYTGYTPLQAEDIAETILFVASRPQHVEICELTVIPSELVDSITFRKKK